MCICTIHCTHTHCNFSTCIYVCVYAPHCTLLYIVHIHTVPLVHVYMYIVCVYTSHCTLPYIADIYTHTFSMYIHVSVFSVGFESSKSQPHSFINHTYKTHLFCTP